MTDELRTRSTRPHSSGPVSRALAEDLPQMTAIISSSLADLKQVLDAEPLDRVRAGELLEAGQLATAISTRAMRGLSHATSDTPDLRGLLLSAVTLARVEVAELNVVLGQAESVRVRGREVRLVRMLLAALTVAPRLELIRVSATHSAHRARVRITWQSVAHDPAPGLSAAVQLALAAGAMLVVMEGGIELDLPLARQHDA